MEALFLLGLIERGSKLALVEARPVSTCFNWEALYRCDRSHLHSSADVSSFLPDSQFHCSLDYWGMLKMSELLKITGKQTWPLIRESLRY